jgi:hypothetical protein
VPDPAFPDVTAPEPRGPGLPPGRYPEHRRVPLWLKIVLGVLAAAVTLPILISATRLAAPDTRAEVTAFTVDGPTRVTATVTITKPTDTAVTCVLQARNTFSEVVGSSEITLAEGEPGETLVRSFPTSDEAVVAEIVECRD